MIKGERVAVTKELIYEEDGVDELPFGLDPRLEVRLHPDDRRAVIAGNSHTYTGRFGVFVFAEGGYSLTVWKSDIASASPYAQGWIDGFLAGSEPDYFYAGDALEDDWRERTAYLRRTGRSLPVDRTGGYLFVAAWRSPRPTLADVASNLDELLRTTAQVFDFADPWDAPLSCPVGQTSPITVPDADSIAELLEQSLHEYSEKDLFPWSGMSDANHLLVTSPETDLMRAGFIRIRVYTGLADDGPAERIIVALDPVDEWPESVDVPAAIARLFATLVARFDPELAWTGPGEVLRGQGFPLFQDADPASDEDAVPGVGLTVGWRTYISARSGIETSGITALSEVSAEHSGQGLIVTVGDDPANPDPGVIARIRASIPAWS